MRLLDHVEQSIRTRGLFHRGQRILAAVSGGVDSMALLHLLQELAPHHGWRITVAHFNHQLRGRSSEADERLVRQMARRLGLPFVAGRGDVRGFVRARRPEESVATESGEGMEETRGNKLDKVAAGGIVPLKRQTQRLSLEMAARHLRHEFLARTAARLKIPTIALAHHADDQIELFFLRLFRGGGSEGLAGMKWQNASPGNPKIQLVRPLLDQTKAGLLAYVNARRIPFREDASNARRDIRRNRIRHELLPLLRRHYQPALDRTVLRFMDIAGAEAEFVTRTAAEWLETKQRLPLARLPVAVQRRGIQLQLQKLGIPTDYELVERLRMRTGRWVCVSPNFFVTLDLDGVLRIRQSRPARHNSASMEVDLNDPRGEAVFAGLRINWRLQVHQASATMKFKAGCEFFDADQVGAKILLRHWRAGDRFQPSGMAGPVKLQDLFTNLKISREARHGLVVAATIEGELFWVEKLRIAERFKLSEGTIRRLQWRWNRL